MKLSLPGSLPLDAAALSVLGGLVAARGSGYQPRTHHKDEKGIPLYTNRLIREPSPYLLQHAHNPVDWYPWGDEAFERARRENRPVLLSVGYSTCHWCHVMEEESFEDLEIAEYMNANYVCIKVDRELRPDVDNIYMQAVQALTGRGGWPMTVWLTPERQPFYAGTYFPPRTGFRGPHPGFLEVLERLAGLYHQEADRVRHSAEQLTRAVREMLTLPKPGDPGEDLVLHRTFRELWRDYDDEKAGLGAAPWFPMPPTLDFCLAYFSRYGDPDALLLPSRILSAMARGGIYDQLGGGFHRYSTDDKWLVPHFEKMMYDQAGLVATCTRAWQLTGDPLLALRVRETCEYVLREMTAPSGAFYAAGDADSEGEEGTFFVWSRDSFDEVLGTELGDVMARWYGVTERGNFEGRNVLFLPRSLEDLAKELGQSPEVLRGRLEEGRAALLAHRSGRTWPHVDTKVLTAWSASMAESLTRAGQVFGEPTWIQAGEKAMGVLLAGATLARLPGSGEPAYAEDFAACIGACITLFEVTSRAEWLQRAINLQREMDQQYQDPDSGGYFLVGEAGEKLLIREKPVQDGVQLSSNAAAASNLLRLYAWTAQDTYRQSVVGIFRMAATYLRQAPRAVVGMATMLMRHLVGPRTVIVTGRGVPEWGQVIRGVAGPAIATVELDPLEVAALARLSPVFEGKAPGGVVRAWCCEGNVCLAPLTTPMDLHSVLRRWSHIGAAVHASRE